VWFTAKRRISSAIVFELIYHYLNNIHITTVYKHRLHISKDVVKGVHLMDAEKTSQKAQVYMVKHTLFLFAYFWISEEKLKKLMDMYNMYICLLC
jgi:hypothetical protein